VTGKGLAGVIKQYYPRPVLLSVVVLVVIANSINIGADIGAVAASAKLVVDAPFALPAVLTAAVVLGLEVFLTYQTYARGLKWLTLALLAYPATALLTPEPWGKILAALTPRARGGLQGNPSPKPWSAGILKDRFRQALSKCGNIDLAQWSTFRRT
jgi:Mn2+/Fe2+ NRAMP family transporter